MSFFEFKRGSTSYSSELDRVYVLLKCICVFDNAKGKFSLLIIQGKLVKKTLLFDSHFTEITILKETST